MIVLGFTGHRDKCCEYSELEKINKEYPHSVWCHGGAIGFDGQVQKFAKEHGIITFVIRPDYEKYGKQAPLIRNKKIVDQSEVIFALYDGRQKGGTYQTINYATRQGKKIVYVPIYKKELI